LLNAFKGAPRIVRLFGKGTVHEFGSPEYEALLPAETRSPGSRSAIVVDVHKVGSSCGYAVPLYDFKSHRTQLLAWASKKEDFDITADAPVDGPPEKGLRAYWAKSNAKSLDGLPAVLSAHKSAIKFKAADSFRINSVNSKPKIWDGMKGFGYFDVKHLISFSVGVLVAVVYFKRIFSFSP